MHDAPLDAADIERVLARGTFVHCCKTICELTPAVCERGLNFYRCELFSRRKKSALLTSVWFSV